MLPRNQYRVALEVSSLNFELKSEDEQDALIDTYESFLNSLPCPMQIIVRVRELDMSKYLADLTARQTDEKEKVYKNQLQNYSEFVQTLVSDNKILSRRFYVILPYGSKDDDFEAAKERLTLNADLVAKGLMRMGMQSRQLGDLEILDLFQSFYNPSQAKRQPITDRVTQLLNNSYIRKVES
ncbi:MAG: TraC family protein [Candidatus Saccharimonadales bacterium]